MKKIYNKYAGKWLPVLAGVLVLACRVYGQPGCSTRTVLFREDFGRYDVPAGSGYCSPNPLPAGITTYNFGDGAIDGNYALCGYNGALANYWYTGTRTFDHTAGNGDGRWMLVNASFNPGQFYTVTISNLCPGTRLYFSAWIFNLVNPNASSFIGGGGALDPNTFTDPDLLFEIKDAADGTVLSTYTTGPIPKVDMNAGETNWRQYGFQFVTGASGSIVFTLYNQAIGGNGNDLLLDDIEVSLCTGPISTSPTRTSVCETGQLKGEYDDISGSFTDASGNVSYTWLYSATGNASNAAEWSVAGQGTTANPVETYLTPAQSGYYRFVVSSPGNYNNVNCRAITAPMQFTIHEFPDSYHILSAGGNPVCQGESSILTAVTNAPGVVWYSDAAMTQQVGANLTYVTPLLDASTTYYVIPVDDEGCIAPASKAVTVPVDVNPRPTAANITGTTGAAVCPGETATISVTTDAAGVQWYSDAALTQQVGTGLSYTTPALMAGATYYVLPVSPAGCAALPGQEVSVPVTVGSRPATPDISGSLSACNNSTGTVYSTVSGMSSYTWTVSGGTIASGGASSDNTVTVDWGATGTGTVTVNYRNSDGCAAIIPATVAVVINRRIAQPTLTGNASVCPGDMHTYTTDAGMSNYTWAVQGAASVTGGGASDNNITVTWPSTPGAGTLTVSYTDASGCTVEEEAALDITVNNVLIPSTIGDVAVCENTAGVTYTTESGMSNYTWSVAGGTIAGGGSAADNTVTVNWGVAGTGSVSVNYQGTAGCTPSGGSTLSVGILPRPAISDAVSAGATICTGETAVLTATVTPGMTAAWYSDAALTNKIGDGATYTTPALAANVTYYLTAVTSGGCLAAAGSPVTVTVGSRPTTADITGTTPATICEGETATISATTANAAIGVNWYTDAMMTNPVGSQLSYTTPALNASAVYYAVPVNSVSGCTALPGNAVPVTVTVNFRPLPNIVATMPATVCAGETATVEGFTTEAGINWYSDAALTNLVGSGFSYTTPPLVATATYYMAIYNTSGCQVLPTYAIPVTATVNARPGAGSIISTTGASICNGQQATISAITNEAGVNWYTDAALTNKVGDRLTFTTPPLAASATYYVVALNEYGCEGLPPVAVGVTVSASPMPVPTVSGTTTGVCSNISTVYTTESGMSNYTWYVDGGTIASGAGTNSITVAWQSSGTGMVSVQYTGACLSETTSQSVNLLTPTVITTQPPAEASACRLADIQLSVSASGISLAYQWYKDGTAISGAISSVYTLQQVEDTDAGSYYVEVTGNCGIVQSSAAKVTISPSDIVQKWDDVILIDNSCFCLSAYQWYRNNTLLTGETKQFFEEKGGLNGTYYAEVTRLDGTKYFTCPLTVVKTMAAVAVRVYPNPVSKGRDLHIEIGEQENTGNMVLEWISPSGQVLRRIPVTEKEMILNVQQTPGSYILRITTPAKSFVKTIIVD